MPDRPPSRTSYHHGDLPRTLLREGAALLAERGVEGFSMREVARRAGVAVAAPSHHFGNARGLLTAIAADGFETLVTHQQAAAEQIEDPLEQVVALCRCYVDMGARFPGHAAVMFRLDLLDDQHEGFREAAFRAFDLLRDAVARAAGQHGDSARVSRGARSLWATMHGLRALTMIDEDEANEIIRFTVAALIDSAASAR